ncbi:MAG: amidohydrolase [Pirellulales bacterium]|nr:amidohydrolase [Pirellulales bacterium]
MIRQRSFVPSAWFGCIVPVIWCSSFPGLATAAGKPDKDASYAITGARIWTGNPFQPRAEAIAIRDDRIVAVGSDEAVRPWIGPNTDHLAASGRFVAPGFIDAHIHFIEGGLRLASVQLRDAKTRDDFVQRIRDFASTVEPGTWITGGDWDHTLWGGELPSRDWIDFATANHPVWMNRLDGHMALANSAALSKAGISQETESPAGGTIVRDAEGLPTGILKDNAMALVERVIPNPTSQQNDRALRAAMEYVAAQGVTSVHHMGTWADLEVFERAHREGALTTRIYAAVPLATWQRLKDRIDSDGRGDAWLRIGGLKGFVDGSLGSHTAAFLEPYTDAPRDRGLLVNSREDLYEQILGGDRAGLQVIVHAIGDRAIRMQLDIFEQVITENGARDRRFRIEHAQHIAPTDIPRFGELDIIPSMQPYHCIDDGRWAEPLIGAERVKTTYAFRSLIEAGCRPAFGSDWYVAPATPLDGIYAAVTRRTLDGKNPNGWVPEQKISVEAALQAYTANAAYASNEEDIKGTLQPGKLADLVLLDRDPTEIMPNDIRHIRIDMTMVGGKIVYERKEASNACSN